MNSKEIKDLIELMKAGHQVYLDTLDGRMVRIRRVHLPYSANPVLILVGGMAIDSDKVHASELFVREDKSQEIVPCSTVVAPSA